MNRFLVVILCALQLAAFAQQGKYSRVKIFTDDAGLMRLAGAGVAVDHGDYDMGESFTGEFSQAEIQAIRNEGFRYEVLIDDLTAFYLQRNEEERSLGKTGKKDGSESNVQGMVVATPASFQLGSMGGFFTYAEALAHLDTMAARWPHLIKARAQIDTIVTIEGRPVFWTRISNNPNTDQAGKPQILFTALHHAREPASLSQIIMFMYYLLENYQTDPEIRYFVDNAEIYFVPIVNPDGYIYNQTTNPNGGGYWRKNRRPVGSDFGVDINRNYGYNWGYDNTGSSNTPFAETYRGTGPFSEPETRIMQSFCNSHTFSIVLNYHTFSNLLIYPWGYKTLQTSDSVFYNDMAYELTQDNRYKTGTGMYTVNYVTNGSSDDWMYGEQGAKPKIFAFTPEAGNGTDGFWPQLSRIVDVSKENIPQNIYALRLLLRYAKVRDTEKTTLAARSGYLHYRVKRFGLQSGTFKLKVQPLSANLHIADTGRVYSSLLHNVEVEDSVAYTLDSIILQGDPIVYTISVDNGFINRTDTITKYFGQSTITMLTDGSSLSGWTSNIWNTTSALSYSPPACIASNPNHQASGPIINPITLTSPIDLTNCSYAHVTFWTQWKIQKSVSLARLEVAEGNDTNWITLQGRYTQKGSASQGLNQPVYDNHQPVWIHEFYNLKAYAGKSIRLRFITKVQAGGPPDFYFDDFVLEKVFAGVPTGMSEALEATLPACYPNPVSDVLHISNSGSGIVTVRDLAGRKMDVVIAGDPAGEATIDVSGLAPGIYFAGTGSRNMRFVKQ